MHGAGDLEDIVRKDAELAEVAAAEAATATAAGATTGRSAQSGTSIASCRHSSSRVSSRAGEWAGRKSAAGAAASEQMQKQAGTAVAEEGEEEALVCATVVASRTSAVAWVIFEQA